MVPILIALTAVLQSSSMLPNPRMELGDQVPTGWTQSYTVSGHLAISRGVRERASSGQSSLWLSSIGDSADGNCSIALGPVAGKRLQAEAKVRIAGDVSDAQLAIFAQDSDFKPIAYTPIINESVVDHWAPDFFVCVYLAAREGAK